MTRIVFILLGSLLASATSARADIIANFRQTGANLSSVNSSVNLFDTWVFEAKSVPGSVPAKNYEAVTLRFLGDWFLHDAHPFAFSTTYPDGSVRNPGPAAVQRPETFFVYPFGTTLLFAYFIDTPFELFSAFRTEQFSILIPDTGERAILAMFSVRAGTMFTPSNLARMEAVSGSEYPDFTSLANVTVEPLPEPSVSLLAACAILTMGSIFRSRATLARVNKLEPLNAS